MPRLFRKIFIFLIIVALCLYLIYNLQILPTVLPLIKAKAITEVTDRVNRLVLQVLSDERYASSGFEQITYDAGGNVVAVTADSAKIAACSGELVAALTKDFANASDLAVRLPLSNLLGVTTESGGRSVRIALTVSNQIGCQTKHEFYECGINQTLHRIYADLNVEIYILLIGGARSFRVSIPCTLSETVIVGQVPQAYTRINRFSDDIAESEIDDIYDFGAAVE